MCIIVSKPQGIKLNKDVYKRCFVKNKDGAGFAYIHNRKIVVQKGYFNFKNFYSSLKEHEDKMLLIHFRISTHGLINEDNCHPFAFTLKSNPNFSFVIAHNGVLPWKSSEKRSDTNHFVVEFLQPILEEDPFWLDRWQNEMLLEHWAGNNKMVIIRLDKEKNCYYTTFINKKAGNEDSGCWFSNYSWKDWTHQVGCYQGGYGYGCGGVHQSMEDDVDTAEPQDDPADLYARYMGWEWNEKNSVWKKGTEVRSCKEMNRFIIEEFKKARTFKLQDHSKVKQTGGSPSSDPSSQTPSNILPHQKQVPSSRAWRKNYALNIWEEIDGSAQKTGNFLTDRQMQDRSPSKLFPKSGGSITGGLFQETLPPAPLTPNGRCGSEDGIYSLKQIEDMTDDQWKEEMKRREQQAAALAKIELMDGKTEHPKIEVPRDIDVDAKLGEDLNHLSRDHRVKIRRMAYECIKGNNDSPKGMSDYDKIIYLREAVKLAIPSMHNLNDIQLDIRIVRNVDLDLAGVPFEIGASEAEVTEV